VLTVCWPAADGWPPWLSGSRRSGSLPVMTASPARRPRWRRSGRPRRT